MTPAVEKLIEAALEITCPVCHAPVGTMCATIRWEPTEHGFYPVADVREATHAKRASRARYFRSVKSAISAVEAEERENLEDANGQS
jgi:hypothetical protein